MFFRKKRRETADRPIWVPTQGGFEITSSRQLIEKALASLEKKRTALHMSQKSKESSPTILLGSTGKYLLIDAPPDWKLRDLAVRIQFKDDAKLDCFFDTKIVYLKDEIVYAKLPEQLSRLQRRAHFRVDVPGGSQVAFAGPADKGDRFAVRNVSAGGMLCRSNRQLARGVLIRDIDLLLTHVAGPQRASHIAIPLGRIVRTLDDRDSGHYFFGVAFECSGKEENSLMAYIRQREIELARTGEV